MNGYIKLYRQLMISPVFENEKLLKVWIWCLLKTTHAELKTLDGLEEKTLEPGQFATGMVKASDELNMPRTTVTRYLKALEKNGMISIKVGTKKTFITVENWELYQADKSKSGHKTDRKRTESGQGVDTYKNDKNDKNDKNKYNPPFIPPTAEEVGEYCRERKNNIDPEAFIDFYQTRGWVTGKVKMKDWKAAVRTWERKDKENGNHNGNTKRTGKYDHIGKRL